MNLYVEVSEVIFMGNSADTRHTSINKDQPGHIIKLFGNERGTHAVLPSGAPSP